MHRNKRANRAAETVKILEQGRYISPSGVVVNISESLQACVAGSLSFTPEQLDQIVATVLASPLSCAATAFEVRNETTLAGASRLVAEGCRRVGVLNFASAKNPGGGFLNGSQAQEESLARGSGLYHSLRHCLDYYEFHRVCATCLYSDRMIYSPQCPVIRDDQDELLEAPYHVDFITSPAPNAGVVRRNEPGRVAQLDGVLRTRALKLLALAIHNGCDAMVLGAWGCGVFQNDPALVAKIFGEHLQPGGPCYGRLHRVAFSVLDHCDPPATYLAFVKMFAAKCCDQ